MAEILKGKPVADAMNEELAPRIEALKAAGMEIIAEQSKNDWMAYIAKRK